MIEGEPAKAETLKESITLDETGQHWEAEMDTMLERDTHIIALHGAGSFNGISIEDANRMLNEELISRIQGYLDAQGEVSIIYDGDNDDPAYPDVGHIMGRLRDHFGNKAHFYAVQMIGWYR